VISYFMAHTLDEDVQNLTTCQVCPPLPVISSCPSMSP
jgi:hypothetical protein